MKKHFILVLAGAILALFLIAGCGTTGRAGRISFTPGTHTGTAIAYGGPIVVDVTFSRNRITNVVVREHAETPYYSDMAIRRIPMQIVEGQTLNVDVVTGVTITSMAILAAVSDAVEQASGDVTALRNAPRPVIARGQDLTLNADVLVIGGGAAGLMAAKTAAQGGMEVVLLEKLSMFGGGAGISSGVLVSYTDNTRSQNNFTASQMFELFMERGNRRGDPVITERIIGMSLNIVKMFEGFGVEFFGRNDMVQPHLPQPYLSIPDRYLRFLRSTSGMKLINPLLYQIERTGNVTILTECRADALLTDNSGTVTGAVGTRLDGSRVTVNAGAVVIATGGFDRNMELMDAHQPFHRVASRVSGSGNTGDGILMAQAVGADMAWVPYAALGSNWGRVPTPGNFLLVGDSGRRVAREGYFYENVAQQVITSGDSRFYRVFDSNYATPAHAEAAANGIIARADTIEGLANMIGVNSSVFLATVARYNSFIGMDDPDFGKDRSLMTGVIRAPFYAVQAGPEILTTLGGIRINENAQVLDINGNIIPSLYAAGDTANGVIFTGRYPTSGAGLIFAFATGIIAANMILGN